MEKDRYQAELFKNRLQKRFKHLSKWAKREKIYAYRLYDKDIPEVPISLDIYFVENNSDTKKPYIVLSLYKRPYEKSEDEENNWLALIAQTACEVLSIPNNNFFIKIRQRQRGKNQYEKLNTNAKKLVVKEGECFFYINLEAYLDTGLFLDHRVTRLHVFKEAYDKSVLNLFSYTGAFSVHAFKGGAISVTSVDLSNTYLDWARENFKLNGFSNNRNCEFIKSDVIQFLKNAALHNLKWDLIICDPPTFSNSKGASEFDLNRDWLNLCYLCLLVLQKNGVLYFSSNSLKLKFDSTALSDLYNKHFQQSQINSNLKIIELTERSIPEDFRNKKIHKLWKISI